MKKLLLFAAVLCGVMNMKVEAQTEKPTGVANSADYLAATISVLKTDWPRNRTVNIICHGHSVPAGYFKTPVVRRFESYPHLLHVGLTDRFPHAVINVIVTAIGGENSEQGAKRFANDVLPLRPDVITIDYALNDRRLGLEKARAAWVEMIKSAQSKGIKVILLTPTPDVSSNLDAPQDPLNLHAAQIRALASEFKVGLVDSLEAFRKEIKQGSALNDLLSQSNHPNKKGHQLVAKELLLWFPETVGN